jgi:predicted nucleic acid-binding protein
LTQQAVTNSTCLIRLERIGQLNLLPQVFSTVFPPPTVVAEVSSPLSWLRVQAVQNTAVIATLRTQMDVGEAEAIALAMELGD